MVCCGTDYVDGGWGMYAIAHNSYVGGFISIGETPTLSPGDYIGIERTSPATFVCSKSSDGRAWTPLMEKSIDSIPNPGFLGADFQTNTNPFRLEVWEGGDGALPTGIGRRCGCEDGTPEFECG